MSEPMVHVIAEFCPVGCDLVILVRCKPSRKLVAFCSMCEAVWCRPSPSGWGAPDFDLTVREAAPGGVELPGEEEVSRSEWLACVLRIARVEEWVDAGYLEGPAA